MPVLIHNIGSYVVNNYLLQTQAGRIALDTGYPGGETVFRKRFEKLAPLKELRYIFLTHAHDDHAGFLAAMLEQTGAKVILHPKGLAALKAGRSEDPPGAGYSSRLASLFSLFKKDFAFPPVTPGERAIFVSKEEDQPFKALGLPLRVVYLPGHTQDSIGLYLEDTGDLFCGDAAMNTILNANRHTIWIEDAVAFGSSWDRMIALKPRRIYPGHGRAFSPKYLVKYRHYMKGRDLIRLR